MNISLRGDNFALLMISAEEDVSQIETLLEAILPVTSEIQAAIDAKYGTLAERQAKQAKLDQPENQMEKLIDRIAQLEAQVKKVP